MRRTPLIAALSLLQGAKEFFTSFLSRDEAYRLIINVWQQSREPGEVRWPPSPLWGTASPAVCLLFACCLLQLPPQHCR